MTIFWGLLITSAVFINRYLNRYKRLFLEISVLVRLDELYRIYFNDNNTYFEYERSHFNSLLFHWKFWESVDIILRKYYSCEILYKFAYDYQIDVNELMECKDLKFFRVDKYRRQ